MKQFWILACALGAAACCETPQQQTALRPSEYVTTLMGTQSEFALSTGNTYPFTIYLVRTMRLQKR